MPAALIIISILLKFFFEKLKSSFTLLSFETSHLKILISLNFFFIWDSFFFDLAQVKILKF